MANTITIILANTKSTKRSASRDDMEMMLNKIVPEGLPYRHSCEGPDDMVSDLLIILWL